MILDLLRGVLAAAMVSLVPWLPVAAQDTAGSDRRIEWSDVRLLDGGTMKAEQLRGRTVVVQIWASWCPFCGAQNPHVQKLHEATRDRGMVVLAFSIDRTEEAARKYVAKHGYTFNVAMHTPQVDQWFGRRRAVPETYVVDAGGRVVLVHRGEMFPEDIAALARFTAQ
jgi:thiol-disulfide isomerase/thioredoxin